MRLVENWQYQFIEKSLYNYNELGATITGALTETEAKIVIAINNALEFFKGEMHETMIKEFYFKAKQTRKTMSNVKHYTYVCTELLATEEPNGYVIRREIIYRIAMECFALGLFKSIRR